MKRILIITAISIVCIFGLYTYLTWNSNGNPPFMHHRYNKFVTNPLAKIGFADAQYKMGYCCLYLGVNPLLAEMDAVPLEEMKIALDNTIYWWEKASAKGHKTATAELAKVKELQSADSTVIKQFFRH